MGVIEHITPLRMVEILREKTGKKFTLAPLTEEDFIAQRNSDNPYVSVVHRTFKYFVEHW